MTTVQVVPRGPAFWVLVAGVFFEGFNSVRVTGALTVGDALILLAGALTLLDAARGGTRLWLPLWLVVALPLFVLGPLTHLLARAGATHADLGYTFTLVLSVFMIPVIIASQRPAERSPQWLLYAWIAGLAVGAVVAWLQFHLILPRFFEGLAWRVAGRVAGLNTNPNILGEGLALVTPACVALALGARAWLPAVAWFGLAAFCIYVADLTGSRAAIAGGVVGTLATLGIFALRTRWSEVPHRFLQAAALGIAVVAFLALRTTADESAIGRLIGQTRTGLESSFVRAQLADVAMRAFDAAPLFGTGYGWLTYRAHNVPLALLEGGGLVGFAGFIIFQVGLGVYAVRTFVLSRAGSVPLTWLATLIGVWCAWLVIAMYQFPILHRHGYIVFGLSVLWWGVAAKRAPAPAEAARDPAWPPPRAVAGS